MYNVNTMTLTASVGSEIDLAAVELIKESYERLGFTSEPVPHHITCRRTQSGSERRGDAVLKTNGHERVYKKRPFDNQVTVVFKTRDGSFLNMKVFRTGKTQMTGAKSEESGEECVLRLKALLGLGSQRPVVRVHLMNAIYDFGSPVDRESLYKEVRERHGVPVSFQPEVHPSVKIGYFSNKTLTGKCQAKQWCAGKETDCCKKVTIMVFHTGKVIFTGATKRSQIDEAFDFITRVLRSL